MGELPLSAAALQEKRWSMAAERQEGARRRRRASDDDRVHLADLSLRRLSQGPAVRHQAALVDTGKLRYVFRDFLLDGVALKAAVVAHCAGLDRYYVFLDAMFANQATWAQGRRRPTLRQAQPAGSP